LITNNVSGCWLTGLGRQRLAGAGRAEKESGSWADLAGRVWLAGMDFGWAELAGLLDPAGREERERRRSGGGQVDGQGKGGWILDGQSWLAGWLDSADS
jgi:hypothetical protein